MSADEIGSAQLRLPHNLNHVDPSHDDCASRLRVVADETRLAVLDLLSGGPRHAGAIQQELGIAANLLSHHLKVLREAGMVTATREGRAIRYALADDVRCRGRAIDLGCCKLTFDDQD